MAEQVAARPLPERPSKNLDELVEQLHRELGRLTGRGAASDTATGSVPKLRGYLRNVQALTWRRVASGDVESPRTVLEQLAEAQAFAAEHLREITDPLAAAAAEVESVLGSLELADEALEQTRVAVRLKDRDTSPREREVLRVLWENRDQYLVRSDIHKRMEESIRPTSGRVGQILADFQVNRLVQRTFGQAQGNPQAAHYALSPLGRELCRKLGIDTEDAIVEPITNAEAVPTAVIQALKTILDPRCPAIHRRISEGLLINLPPEELRHYLNGCTVHGALGGSIERLIRFAEASRQIQSHITRRITPQTSIYSRDPMMDILSFLNDRVTPETSAHSAAVLSFVSGRLSTKNSFAYAHGMHRESQAA